MSGISNDLLKGLTSEQVRQLADKYGANEIAGKKKQSFIFKLFHVISEPMFLLLIAAGIIYFLLGEPADGIVMLVFVGCIISIDIIQEWKTDKTLEALRELTAPYTDVIRDGQQKRILSRELVPGDIMLISEGIKVPADGVIIKCSDLCIDESSMTGEPEPVWKRAATDADQTVNQGGGEENTDAEAYADVNGSGDKAEYFKKDRCYAGTLVIQGTAAVKVENIGGFTEYGKISKNTAEAPEQKTPLQKQTAALVKLCAVIAAALMVLTGIFTYMNIADGSLGERIIKSVLSGITLAMAMIPEEFPVILTVFLSMGAWRLAQKKSLVRKLPSVETLGAVSVLCVDKTGTITVNKMTVSGIWEVENKEGRLCRMMGLACETDAYDPMEKAMLDYCRQNGYPESTLFNGTLIKEYAFTNELKMMGHVWFTEGGVDSGTDGEYVIACKGSAESIVGICSISDDDKQAVMQRARQMSEHGLRVIAVAGTVLSDRRDIPQDINECRLEIYGLVGLSDPPRESIDKSIGQCLRAGIRVVMITGDSAQTAAAIAEQVGIENCGGAITGDMLEQMTDEQLRQCVKTSNIFARVIPEHKMRIVKAFKDNGHTVGMTGDGVNDAPALKYADIGIAMGGRGSEVSREAADLILTDDNFSVIVDTIRDGRRIYDNIKKAVGYIFTIHIPIAAASLLAPIMGINPASLLFLPVHIVLMELIIDPTCSIVLERQPEESDIMERPPRSKNQKIMSATLLAKSVLQGIAVFAASFGTYFYMLGEYNVQTARTMGIVIIMLANLFLVYENSSDTSSAAECAKRLAKDRVIHAVNILTVLGIAVITYSPLNGFLGLAPLGFLQMLSAFGIAAVSVLWYEIVKARKRRKIAGH